MNYPLYSLRVNTLIKQYLNMYFYHKFIEKKYITRKMKRNSFNRIYVSRSEIKHTNSKALVTIYIYNRQ